MNTTLEIDSNLFAGSSAPTTALAPVHRGAKFVTETHRDTPVPHTVPAAESTKSPELTTFRALTRQVYGIEATREYMKEAIVFATMVAVAAWPLSVTLNQLGTMMISP